MNAIIEPAFARDDELLLQYSGLVLMLKTLHLQQPSNRHYRYLYNQSFYGFTGFLDPRHSTRISQGAHEQYAQICQDAKHANLPPDLRDVHWDLQPKFDAGRKIFHLEHIFTGSMFRTAIENLRDARDIAEFATANYRLAWILKSEDQALNDCKFRQKRGTTLDEALAAYATAGITLK